MPPEGIYPRGRIFVLYRADNTKTEQKVKENDLPPFPLVYFKRPHALVFNPFVRHVPADC